VGELFWNAPNFFPNFFIAAEAQFFARVGTVCDAMGNLWLSASSIGYKVFLASLLSRSFVIAKLAATESSMGLARVQGKPCLKQSFDMARDRLLARTEGAKRADPSR
jgi:hypothetical protein